MWLFLESQENPTNHQKLLRGKEMEGERSLIKSFQHLKSLSAQVLEKPASEWVSWIPEFRKQFPKDSLMCRCHPPGRGKVSGSLGCSRPAGPAQVPHGTIKPGLIRRFQIFPQQNQTPNFNLEVLLKPE